MKTIQDYLKEQDAVSLIQKTVDEHAARCWVSLNEQQIKDLIEAYTSVYQTLISFGEWTWFRSTYEVSAYVNPPLSFGDTDNEPVLEISLLNKNYDEPPAGLKWWGGDPEIKDDAPEGHYNVNYSDHNKYYSVDGMPWRVTVNLELDIDDTALDYSIEDILVEYMYSVTFNGFREKSYLGMKKDLQERMEETDYVSYEDAMKEINDYSENRDVTDPKNAKESKVLFTKEAVEDLKRMVDKPFESD